MFRTARITFADLNGARSITAQVWYVEGESQYWHDNAVWDAVERNCSTYGDVGIIDFAWVN